ncbi:MAG: hypothetical protein ACP5H8_01810 [Candidatus Micrarchaeia archaeon]
MTTSRKCGPITRRLARSLANVFSCVYENRGKRNFDSILRMAHKRGCKRVVFVYESHGNPNELFAVDLENDEWKEAGRIIFNPVLVEKIPKKKWAVCYDKDDELANLLVSMLNPDKIEHVSSNTVRIIANNGRLDILIDGKRAVSLNLLDIEHA